MPTDSTTTNNNNTGRPGKRPRGGDAEGNAKSWSGVLNEDDFKRIRGELQDYDQKREKIIKMSRDVQKLSKQAIFSLHRKDFKRAEDQLAKAATTANGLLPLVENEPNLRGGSYSNSIEEYAEARIFQNYLAEGYLLSSAELPLASNEEYLGGVLDFCGELNRFAVQRATARDEDQVKKCRDLVENIMDQYLQFDFRNSQLRRKYDALKYTLKNLESMLYDLVIHSGIKKKEDKVPPAGEAKGAEED